MTRDLSQESDEWLLESYAQGDAQAFEEFFLRHKGRVYHYVLKRLQRPEVAAELVQDVFLKLHAKIHQYQPGQRALPWFFTIVHHACIDELRRQTSARRVSAAHESEQRIGRVMVAPDPDVQVDHSMSAISQSMHSLTDDQRRLIESRIVDGKSFRQISDETGRTEVALRKIYSRAIERVRDWFKTHERGEDDK